MNAMERLEEITQGAHCWSDFDFGRAKPRPYQFRVHCGIVLHGQDELHEQGFWYYDLPAARRGYRNILLRLYRAKDIAGFAIALNRLDDILAQEPLFTDMQWIGDGDGCPEPIWIAEIGKGSRRFSALPCYIG